MYYGLKERVEVLPKVIQKHKGYKNVVTHNGDQLSEYFLFYIRNKCIFLRKAYEIALEKMGKFDKSTGKVVQQWKKVCCQEAVDACNDLGLGTTRCAGTVRKWNHVFSQHRGKFPHPNPHTLTGIKPMPLFFKWYPSAAIDCKIYVLSIVEA